MNKGKHCPFCGTDQALFTEGTPEAELHAISTRTLATFGEVRLCAGLGAIVEPYIIAYTRRHFHAATELDAAHRGDLLDALDGCLATKHFPSRKLTVFEHGSKLDRGSSACISHCHWHIIDGQYDLRAPLAITYQNVETASLSEAEVFVADEYLFTGSYDGRRIVSGVVARPPNEFRSQYFRQVVAQLYGGGLPWNWRLSPRLDAAVKLKRDWNAG